MNLTNVKSGRVIHVARQDPIKRLKILKLSTKYCHKSWYLDDIKCIDFLIKVGLLGEIWKTDGFIIEKRLSAKTKTCSVRRSTKKFAPRGLKSSSRHRSVCVNVASLSFILFSQMSVEVNVLSGIVKSTLAYRVRDVGFDS